MNDLKQSAVWNNHDQVREWLTAKWLIIPPSKFEMYMYMYLLQIQVVMPQYIGIYARMKSNLSCSRLPKPKPTGRKKADSKIHNKVGAKADRL